MEFTGLGISPKSEDAFHSRWKHALLLRSMDRLANCLSKIIQSPFAVIRTFQDVWSWSKRQEPLLTYSTRLISPTSRWYKPWNILLVLVIQRWWVRLIIQHGLLEVQGWSSFQGSLGDCHLGKFVFENHEFNQPASYDNSIHTLNVSLNYVRRYLI